MRKIIITIVVLLIVLLAPIIPTKKWAYGEFSSSRYKSVYNHIQYKIYKYKLCNKRQYLSSLYNRDDEKSEAELLSYIDSNESYIRSIAIRTLGSRKSNAAVPPLLAKLENPESSLTAKLAIEALGKIQDRKALPKMMEILTIARGPISQQQILYSPYIKNIEDAIKSIEESK